MRFDSSKAWPHPVLRPRAMGTTTPRLNLRLRYGSQGAKAARKLKCR